MTDMGRWAYLALIPVLFGVLIVPLIYAVRVFLRASPRFHQNLALVSQLALVVTILAATAGFITATLLADQDRLAWARAGLNACHQPQGGAEDLAASPGTPIDLDDGVWATFRLEAASGYVTVYGPGSPADGACDSRTAPSS